MLKLNDVKEFLKIDFDDENTLIELLIRDAYEYLEDTTGFDFKESDSAIAETFCLTLINECYKDRGLTVEKAGNQMRFIMKDKLIKLSYKAKKLNKEKSLNK